MKTTLLLSAILFSISANAQNDSSLTVHEWGTFTTLQSSNGERLSGLQKDEEALPTFVYNIAHSHYYTGFLYGPKGYLENTWFEHVNVKMETPVLYFYSGVQRNVSVNVHFNQGSISQWYPSRSDGEALQYQNHLDFSQSKTGWIKWNARILPPNSSLSYSGLAALETPQWVRPRATASNLVQSENGEVEKFLFYRGLANFDVPLKVEFNNLGKLVITNNGSEKINYVVVYEKAAGQQATIWWSGAINSNEYKIACRPAMTVPESVLNNSMSEFEDALVNAGLYRDEAKAMLHTWEESYFQHDGLKVFWIAPRSFTDNVLPIEISPVPDYLERVIVGRSEILTPEKENLLKQGTEEEFTAAWGTDRYSEAYHESRSKVISEWTARDGNCPSPFTSIDDYNSVVIFPNPVSEAINIQSSFNSNETKYFEVHIYNSMGSELIHLSEAAQGTYYKSIPMNDYAPGIYLVKVQSGANTITSLKLIKN